MHENQDMWFNDIDKVINRVKRNEGFRDRIYFDTKGIPTGGYGHAFLVGSYLPPKIWELIFEYDLMIALQEADAFIRDYGLEAKLNKARVAVIYDMTYNMGRTKLSRFQKMIKAMQDENWAEAARQILDSKYAKDVGKRAIENAEIMETGDWGRV